MARVYVGLGSNLRDPESQIRTAFAALRKLAPQQSFKRSSIYTSAPISTIPQPDYLNAVAAFDTGLDPAALLDALRSIETAQGRERIERNAARTLDLDVLLYDDLEYHSADLTLPHPRMAERRFVLVPLEEIAPELHIPGLGPLSEVLARCPPQDLHLFRS